MQGAHYGHKASLPRQWQPSARSKLAALFAPLDFLMVSGGDTRLTIDPKTRLNRYGCSPFPRPEALGFASSTASSISEPAYAQASHACRALMDAAIMDEGAFDARIESVRTRLAAHLGLAESGAQVVLCPSGTDAQLFSLFAVRTLLGGPLTSVVVAADETGSGTGFAVTGRHFDSRTALGHAVVKGETLAGLEGIRRIDIETYAAMGRRHGAAEIDRAVIHAVADAVHAGRRVLLLSMDSSKLGRRAPTQACLDSIAARWQGAVQLVVDACQMRLSSARLRHHLACGAIVLMTGSKFFTGPAYSGALIIPENLSRALACLSETPQGLRQYSNAYDWPTPCDGIRSQLPHAYNVGQWLRWEAALTEIEAYFSVPQDFRADALNRYNKAAVRVICESGFLPLEEDFRDTNDTIDDAEFAARTIVPFMIRHNGEVLSRETTAGLYRALNCDVSGLLPPGASAEQKLLAAKLCHIGQPVPIRTADGAETNVLRISAGARTVSERYSNQVGGGGGNPGSEYEQILPVAQKLGLLLRHQIAMSPRQS